MRLFWLAAASLAASAVCASAQTTSAPTAAPAKAAANAGDKVVCHSSIPTGTHFPVKECHTQAEWDQIAADSRQMTQDSQRNYGPH